MPNISVTSNVDEVLRKMKNLRADLRPVAMAPAAKALGKEMERRFKQTTKTWDHQPKWETRVTTDASGTSVSVGTDDQVYQWLNDGTKGPYPIEPKGRGYPLRFLSGYNSKTRAASARGNSFPLARKGGPFGAVVRTMRVMHPGIKARDFVGAVRKAMDSKTVFESVRKSVYAWMKKHSG